jgi:hypothetical protein
LIIGGVVLVAGATLIVFGSRVGQRRGMLDEGARMQRLYVALSMYESQLDGAPAPSLAAARPYAASARDFVSDRDPFRDHPGPFPGDGSLPEARGTSTFRVSDGYLWAHWLAGRIRVPKWTEAREDPTLGQIANEWFGDVTPGQAFRAQVSGLVLRINTDGSFVRVQRGGPKPLGDAQDLFRKAPERK